MNSLIQADIFFFITSIFVVVLTIVLIIGGYYLIKSLRNFYHISELVKNYAKDTDDELRDIGEHIRNSPIFRFIFGKRKNKKGN
jgi:uncharacterized membrane protein